MSDSKGEHPSSAGNTSSIPDYSNPIASGGQNREPAASIVIALRVAGACALVGAAAIGLSLLTNLWLEKHLLSFSAQLGMHLLFLDGQTGIVLAAVIGGVIGFAVGRFKLKAIVLGLVGAFVAGLTVWLAFGADSWYAPGPHFTLGELVDLASRAAVDPNRRSQRRSIMAAAKVHL